MLKYIVKRDNRVELFDPKKLNKWAIWASKDIDSDKVDWSSVVMDTVRYCNESITSQELQTKLIETCKYQNTEAGLLMAGKLAAVLYRKNVFGKHIPTIKQLHSKLIKLGLMLDLHYTDSEYEEIEKIINHDKDFTYYEYQLKYARNKYFIQDKSKNVVYETMQFAYMRIAMSTCSNIENKIHHVKELYTLLSNNKLNIPTPVFGSFGTPFPASASCCLYSSADNKDSIAASNHITENMTLDGAGLGNIYNVRSIKDSIRKGSIIHKGKLPYFNVLSSLVTSSMQGSRGGAATTYVSIYDPEILDILILPNVKTPENIRNDKIQYGIVYNSLVLEKAKQNKDVFLFNCYTAPDLYKSLFSADIDKFKELYSKYENDNTFVKKYVNARELISTMALQERQTGKIYRCDIEAVNKHTSFKESINSSNLCIEIYNVTKPYETVVDLYKDEDHGRGEVGICTLGAINVDIDDDETYYKAAYYSLLIAEHSIDTSNFKLKHVSYTSKARRNVGIGMVNLAYVMAKNDLKFNTKEGISKINLLAERHAYMVIKASLELGKQLGNALWIDKTKWVDGWLPIDTYNKNIDKYVDSKLNYNWESLREEIKLNKGIRHSSLIAHMPVKSSYKASGVTQGVYPIEQLFYTDNDGSNSDKICVPKYDKLKNQYQSAFDLSVNSQILFYAVIQKFTDQGVSANEYNDRVKKPVIKDEDAISSILLAQHLGLKSKYYTVSNISNDVGDVDKIGIENRSDIKQETVECENCTL